MGDARLAAAALLARHLNQIVGKECGESGVQIGRPTHRLAAYGRREGQQRGVRAARPAAAAAARRSARAAATGWRDVERDVPQQLLSAPRVAAPGACERVPHAGSEVEGAR